MNGLLAAMTTPAAGPAQLGVDGVVGVDAFGVQLEVVAQVEIARMRMPTSGSAASAGRRNLR